MPPAYGSDGDLYRRKEAELIHECRQLADRGLVVAAAGNASARVGEHILVTCSGAAFARLTPEDLSLVDSSGDVVSGSRRPTSELALHLLAHQRPDVAAVMHTHGRHAVALSTVAAEVPAVHYYIVDLGGAVPVAPYRQYGTSDLAMVTTQALGSGSAVVMSHHGSLTIGTCLAQAAARAELLEWLCQVALLALGAGAPATLTPAELTEVHTAMQASRRRAASPGEAR